MIENFVIDTIIIIIIIIVIVIVIVIIIIIWRTVAYIAWRIVANKVPSISQTTSQ